MADAMEPQPKIVARIKQRVSAKRNNLHMTYHLPTNRKLSREQQRQWSRRRLRRLSAAEKQPARRINYGADKKNPNKTLYNSIMLTIIVICVSIGISLCRNSITVSNFMQQYSIQYQTIKHNKFDYCDRTTPLSTTFGYIRNSVLNQEAALSKLEQELGNYSSFQSLALVGPSGVGKSLTVRLLQMHFPWVDNVYTFAWGDQTCIEGIKRYKQVQSMADNLSQCGRNLIIIDNMSTRDHADIPIINEMLSERSGTSYNMSDENLNQLTVIYVFNLNFFTLDNAYETQDMLPRLPYTPVINYRTFGHKEVENCIRHEAELENMEIDDAGVTEILSSANIRVSGCKTVRAKLLIYGRPKTKANKTDLDPAHTYTNEI